MISCRAQSMRSATFEIGELVMAESLRITPRFVPIEPHCRSSRSIPSFQSSPRRVAIVAARDGMTERVGRFLVWLDPATRMAALHIIHAR